MSLPQTLILVLYFFVLSILAIYGWHRYYLVYLYMKNKGRAPAPLPVPDVLPRVTIQLPIFNEMYVADRLIDAVCEMDYPKELLEIQVLDDSTDETRDIAELAVRRHAAKGFNIHYLHRVDRRGYKAGALEAGLREATGEFIAIFDADFIPSRDFLQRTLPHFDGLAKIGMVQARWGHINQDYSLLTKIQSILLDAHFVLEHGGRNRAGLLLQLQRHGRRLAPRGDRVGRRLAARHADRGSRPQLPRAARRLAVRVPARRGLAGGSAGRDELVQVAAAPLGEGVDSDLHEAAAADPAVEAAARRQGGGVLPPVGELQLPADVGAVDPDVPGDVGALQHGLDEMLLIDVPLFAAATLSVCNFYMVSQRELYPNWRQRLKYLPFLMSIGIGLCVNNTRAVLEAIFGKQSEFARTPKYGIERDSDEWVGKKYHQSVGVQPIIELALGLYFTGTVFYALANQIYGTLPFLMLFQIGFLYTGLLSILQQYTGEDVMLKAPEVAK